MYSDGSEWMPFQACGKRTACGDTVQLLSNTPKHWPVLRRGSYNTLFTHFKDYSASSISGSSRKKYFTGEANYALHFRYLKEK